MDEDLMYLFFLLLHKRSLAAWEAAQYALASAKEQLYGHCDVCGTPANNASEMGVCPSCKADIGCYGD